MVVVKRKTFHQNPAYLHCSLGNGLSKAKEQKEDLLFRSVERLRGERGRLLNYVRGGRGGAEIEQRRSTRGGSKALFAQPSGSAIFTIKDKQRHRSADLLPAHPSRGTMGMGGGDRRCASAGLWGERPPPAPGPADAPGGPWQPRRSQGGFPGPESQLRSRFAGQDRVAAVGRQGERLGAGNARAGRSGEFRTRRKKTLSAGSRTGRDCEPAAHVSPAHAQPAAPAHAQACLRASLLPLIIWIYPLLFNTWTHFVP